MGFLSIYMTISYLHISGLRSERSDVVGYIKKKMN